MHGDGAYVSARGDDLLRVRASARDDGRALLRGNVLRDDDDRVLLPLLPKSLHQWRFLPDRERLHSCESRLFRIFGRFLP